MVIWKFETEIKQISMISMPKGAEILCVQIDQKTNRPCIWALVEPENETEYRCFELIGTGREIEKLPDIDLLYIATYQHGAFVGHLFEHKQREKKIKAGTRFA